MAGKKDNVEDVITADWLKTYIDETQKYDIRDWYLALSLRKQAYDFLVQFYDHPQKWLSFPGHLTFKSALAKRQLTRQLGSSWEAFVLGMEDKLSALIQFQKKYPAPDEKLHTSVPFTIIDFLDEGSLRVLIITPDNHCREYQATDIDSVLLLHDAFSNDTYELWEMNRTEPLKIIEHLNTLSEQIKTGNIFNFSEKEIIEILPKTQNGSDSWLEVVPFVIDTRSQNEIFHHVISSINNLESKHTGTYPPEKSNIDWKMVYFGDKWWSVTSERKSVLAEINLMKSDIEIKKEFNIWLKKTRRELNQPQPKKMHLDTHSTETVTKELRQTLALAFIDFKIIEFVNKEKISESCFFKAASNTRTFLPRYEKHVKNVIKKAMSADFMRQLAKQTL